MNDILDYIDTYDKLEGHYSTPKYEDRSWLQINTLNEVETLPKPVLLELITTIKTG